MAPTADTLKQLRWRQEEIDILVNMTSDQLQLEAQDKSRMITWSSHWNKVSARLKEHGYSRSWTACRGYWKRGVEAQRVTIQAAGPEWDDSEHEILVHMTKKQLEREKADPSTSITWAKHWKNVSLQLEEQGYDRTVDNCVAYWDLVENVESGSDIDGEDEDEGHRSPESEDVRSSELAVTSPQVSKTSLWSPDEYENLFGLLKARRELEEKKGLEHLEGKKLWTEIAESHKRSGYDRSFEACRTFWFKQGRERSGWDEREKPTNQNVQPSTAKASGAESNSWSSINGSGVQESIETQNPAIESLRKFQKEQSIQNRDSMSSEPSPAIDAVSFEPNPIISKAIIPIANTDSEIELEGTPGQPEKKQRKKGVTNFRLNEDQRAMLEAEVAKGVIISSERKQELAQELGLEYKTVRNWFTNYNVKARRSQGSTPIIPTAKSAVKSDLDDSFHDGHIAATPTPAYIGVEANFKRPVVNDAPHYTPSSKKPRLEPEVEQPRPTSGFNPVNGISNHRHPLPQSHATQLPRPPVILSNATSRPIESKPFSSAAPAHINNHPPLLYPSNMIYNDHDNMRYMNPTNSHRINNESSSQSSEMAGEQTFTETRTVKPQEIRNEVNYSINRPEVNDSQTRDRRTPTQTEGFQEHRQPGIEARTPLPDPSRPDFVRLPQRDSVSVANLPVEAVSVGPPMTQRASPPTHERVSQIFEARKNETTERVNLEPHSVPANPSSSRSSSEVRASKPILNPTLRNNMSPASSLLPTSDDPKETAHRQVQSFSSDIKRLKEGNARRLSKIADLSQQLDSFADQRNAIDRNKQVEITRTLQELEQRYEDQYATLREHEDGVRRSKQAEVQAFEKYASDLSKKEKGLARWQSLLDYYQNEGEDA